jgi:glycosyltransferase involved in cell wall biosynthesis
MSVPLLLHVFPSFATGGAQVRFAALANRFGNRWRHAVVALDGNDTCLERIGSHVPLEMLPSPTRRGEPLPRAMLSIGLMLRRLRPDLLVTSNWGSMEWAIARMAMPGLPHLHTEDGFGPEESQGQFRRRILTRRLALRRSTVVVPSSILLQTARQSWKLPSGRVHHIPNGLDLSRFRPDGPAKPVFPDGAGPLLGTIAALRPEKNLGRLLRAAARLRGEGLVFRLVILGDGPERGLLEALAAELGLGETVRFIGHLPDPAAAYRAIDLFVLSSDTEQMPFSVLEAMATGLPVAATDAGDMRAMLPEESQPFISAKDDIGLGEAMRPLVQDAALRARIGQANHAKALRDYDQEAMFQAHATLIDRACAPTAGGRAVLGLFSAASQ